jgi:hypothetical protein
VTTAFNLDTTILKDRFSSILKNKMYSNITISSSLKEIKHEILSGKITPYTESHLEGFLYIGKDPEQESESFINKIKETLI